MFQIEVVVKIKTHILRKSCLLWDNVKNYCLEGQITYDNMAHAHCMLDTQGYKYTHSGCVTLIAFPLQQWLHECALVLRYKYIACFVFSLEIKFLVVWDVFGPTLKALRCFETLATVCQSTHTVYANSRFALRIFQFRHSTPYSMGHGQDL
jgi:hypothetical protein